MEMFLRTAGVDREYKDNAEVILRSSPESRVSLEGGVFGL